MKLYNSAFAPNPRRVRIFCAEKNLKLPTVDLDLAKLEHKAEDYAVKNAFETVPALELDDGSVIVESIAICRYLEELHPEPNLFGANARERAEVEMWQRLAELQLFYPIAQTFRHTHPAVREWEKPQIPDWAAACKAKAALGLARFDAALSCREYLAGERFTIADITGVVALDFARPARIEIPETLERLKRWREKVAARPSMTA